jgi:hypothetical protein
MLPLRSRMTPIETGSFRGEIHDFLLDVVFEDSKVIRLQTGDNAVEWIGDGDID